MFFIVAIAKHTCCDAGRRPVSGYTRSAWSGCVGLLRRCDQSSVDNAFIAQSRSPPSMRSVSVSGVWQGRWAVSPSFFSISCRRP